MTREEILAAAKQCVCGGRETDYGTPEDSFGLIGQYWTVYTGHMISIVSFSNSTRIYCGGTSEYFRPEDIGKTFFLTHEAAEKALEAMKDGY